MNVNAEGSFQTPTLTEHCNIQSFAPSSQTLFLIHGKKSHIKVGACRPMIGETLPQKFRRGITADICSYACTMNQGQELEPNSVIKDTEQLFNSVNNFSSFLHKSWLQWQTPYENEPWFY